MQVFRRIYDQVNDEKLRDISVALIETEGDQKYRKKYLGLWKDFMKAGKGK